MTRELGFTPRQIELLQRKSIGVTNERIAHSFGITPRKVSDMWSAIYEKFGVETKAAAVCDAIIRGLIRGPEPRPPLRRLHPSEEQLLPYLPHDIKTEEIASIFNITPGNLKVRISRISACFGATSRENLSAILVINYLSQQ
jgi:DNA-binding CsgD family transcriptional regulator